MTAQIEVAQINSSSSSAFHENVACVADAASQPLAKHSGLSDRGVSLYSYR
jgi:hypothetical protein